MKNNEQLIEHIDHDGIVEKVDTKNGTVTVKINEDECGECPAAKLCSMASGAHSTNVPVERPESFREGEHVILRGTERMHRRAIMVATVIPCIALVCIMVIIFIVTANQAAAALGGLASMIFFFSLLYLCRNKIAHEFHFDVIHDDKKS